MKRDQEKEKRVLELYKTKTMSLKEVADIVGYKSNSSIHRIISEHGAFRYASQEHLHPLLRTKGMKPRRGMSFKTAETYSRVIGETGMKCLCGLDHSKPFPEVFEWPPIVMAFLEGYPARSNCHVCHVEALNSEFKTSDDFPHAEDCAYHKYRIKEQLREIVDKLAYPEKHAKDYSTWYSGDGPFEAYCNKLQSEAKIILEKYDKTQNKKEKSE